MELREFIEARLADDQKIAEDAYALDENWPFWVDVDDEHHYRAACKFRERLGPARVLRDVEAKRRLLALYLVTEGSSVLSSDAWTVMKVALSLLTLPYADHPDCDPSWVPENVTPPS